MWRLCSSARWSYNSGDSWIQWRRFGWVNTKTTLCSTFGSFASASTKRRRDVCESTKVGDPSVDCDCTDIHNRERSEALTSRLQHVQGVDIPGTKAMEHHYWLYPVVVEEPQRVSRYLTLHVRCHRTHSGTLNLICVHRDLMSPVVQRNWLLLKWTLRVMRMKSNHRSKR